MQSEILAEHFGDLDVCKERRKRLFRLIAAEMSAEPMMLRSMKVLGVGMVSAFALLAVIGNVRRFERPEKLVAYIGLNPGQRQSGTSKNIKLGVGKRGRGDIRHLLIQGAQAVLRMGRATALGQWGWKLFARKGNRNVAVAAVARKLLVQVWHMLSGNPPTALETDKSFTLKLHKLAVVLGAPLRRELRLGDTLPACIRTLRSRTLQAANTAP
jgi:transposase